MTQKEELKIKASQLQSDRRNNNSKDIENHIQLIENTAQNILQNNLKPLKLDINKKKLYSLLAGLENNFVYDDFKKMRYAYSEGFPNRLDSLNDQGSIYIMFGNVIDKTLKDYKPEKGATFFEQLKKNFYFVVKDFFLNDAKVTNPNSRNEIKLITIRKLLKKCVEEHHDKNSTIYHTLMDKIDSTSTLKLSRIQDIFLKALDIKSEKEREAAWNNFKHTYLDREYSSSLDIPVNNEQDGATSIADFIADTSISENEIKDREDDLCNLCEKISMVTNKLHDEQWKKYLNGLGTILITNFELIYRQKSIVLDPYVNTEIQQYYIKELQLRQINFDDILSIKKGTIIDILAKYMQAKPDTVRKYSAKIKNQIQILELTALSNL